MKPWMRRVLAWSDDHHLELLVCSYGLLAYLIGYRRGRKDVRHL